MAIVLVMFESICNLLALPDPRDQIGVAGGSENSHIFCGLLQTFTYVMPYGGGLQLPCDCPIMFSYIKI